MRKQAKFASLFKCRDGHLSNDRWQRFEICRIEDLCNAVLGAELEVIQMAGSRVRGSLAFAARNGIIFSSGLIDGEVAIRGALSSDALTLGVGLLFGPGSRHWLSEVTEGDVGIFLPGDEHDAYYTARSLYMAATLTTERLVEEAEREGLVLDWGLIRATGIHSTPIALDSRMWLREQLIHLHEGDSAEGADHLDLGGAMLRMVINHCSCVPNLGDGRVHPKGLAMIVHRARAYIRENLAAPISVDDIAKVAETSQRTLHRAFSDIFHDTPHGYVRRLQLHRIRHALISDEPEYAMCRAARDWGFASKERLSIQYRELFGETPRATLKLGRARRRANAWL